jgi:hypothetical protein
MEIPMRILRTHALLIAAVCMSVVAATARAQSAPAKTPTAAEIVSRAGKSADPNGKLASHRSVRSTFTIEILGMGINGTGENYSARPDRMLSNTTLGPIGTISAGYNGSVGWVVNPATGPILMDSAQMARVRHVSAFDAALQRAESYKSMSEPVTETFEGRPCYRLHLVSTTSFEYDAFYDVEKGFRRGIRYEEKGPGGIVPVTMIFDDFRDFGGLMVPGTVTQRTPTVSLVQRLNTVDFDAVADSVFALPPAIKALAGK